MKAENLCGDVTHCRTCEAAKDLGVPGSRLRPTPALEGWQPIETAPKDKGKILAWPVFGGVEKVHWYQDSRKGVWIADSFHVHPTHWMPIPEPPNARQREGGSGIATEGATVPSQPLPDSECSNKFCTDGWVDKEYGTQDGSESWVDQVPCQVCCIHCDPPESVSESQRITELTAELRLETDAKNSIREELENAKDTIAELRKSQSVDTQGKLVEALRSIRDHPHNSYEASSVEVADGHRCAANIAREALALLPDEVNDGN